MKNFAYHFAALVAVLFGLSHNTAQAQTAVTNWGILVRGPAPNWKFVPSTTPGNAGLAGTVAPNGPWSVIRGEFPSPITATESQAIVVTGKMEFIGAGPETWGALRYGLFRHDSAGTVQYANTDTARWMRQVGGVWVNGKESDAYGYLFQPRSGTNDQPGWAVGGGGALGVVRGGAWVSTFGNAHVSLGIINQKPLRAVATAGMYKFAISVQPRDGANEVRFYFVKEDNSYWIGGIVTDTTKITTSFNGVCFGLNGGNGAETGNLRGLNLIDVQVDLGTPITIPEAPWQAFYVEDWGIFARGPAPNWKFVPGEVIGNAGLAGTAAPNGPWTVVRGGFPEAVTATAQKAIIVTGKMEFIGAGPETWGALRYGLFRHDSAGTVQYANTDTARWMRQVGGVWVNGKESDAYGYLFQPRSGTNDQPGWAVGGGGALGVVRGGAWVSTFGNAHVSLGIINQKPLRAVATAGMYKFAISVQPKDGANEVRFYFVKEDNSYWIGGIVTDTTKITTSFNGVCFGLNGGNGAETGNLRGLNLIDVQVDLGTPITIPEAPWQAFYVEDWGIFARGPAPNWKFVPGEVIGNAGLAGTAAPNGPWTVVRGGFPEAVTATAQKAIIVTGKMEFIGAGPETWGALRYGLFRHDSAGTVQYANTDTARWMRQVGGVWVNGKESDAYGYLFQPRSGTNDQPGWAVGGGGALGVVRGGAWVSTFGNAHVSLGIINQKPLRAVATAGMYKFAISVQPKDGANEVRFYFVKEDNSYWIGGIVTDTTKITTSFNGVCFGLNGGNGAETGNLRGLNLIDVQVDLGTPITIPEAPWQAFYVEDWGIFARGPAPNWKFVPGEVIGNAGVAGTAPTSQTWTVIRGGFPEAVTPTASQAIIVTGKMEFIGAGPQAWSSLRYGLFRHDSAGTVQYANTDTARWMRQVGGVWVNGKESDAYGYMFTPRSGTNTHASWAVGGNGTAGVIRGGAWVSTFGNAHASLGMINQRPVNAVAGAGRYNFAISVHPKADGSGNEVRWYFIKEDNSYWIGGTVVDTFKITSSFNGVCFGLIDNSHANLRGFNVVDIQVDLGTPITIPEAPWVAYYVEDWGFIGGRMGGWKFTPGEVVGNATISGTAPNTDWSAIRGGFADPVVPTATKALVVTGKVGFVGGGFGASGSFRFGVFYSDSAGTLIKTNVDSTRWSGKETAHSGYLFLPQSGTNGLLDWTGAQQGSWGAIVNGSWMNPMSTGSYVLGRNRHEPTNAAGGAGTYDFAISVARRADGTNDVRVKLTKSDNSYSFQGKAIDNRSPVATDKFNAVAFALNAGNTTTAMNLIDVQVDLGDTLAITTGVEIAAGEIIPTEFALMQNYPNPFNPSTTIQYDLPTGSHVTLRVHDMLGRVVATLFDGVQPAGRYSARWDASGLSSGVYFYRIDARSQDGAKTFTSVKKLILMK